MRLPFSVKQSIFLEAALIFIERNRFVLEEMEFQGVSFCPWVQTCQEKQQQL